MKTMKSFSLRVLAILGLALMFTACSKEDDDNPATAICDSYRERSFTLVLNNYTVNSRYEFLKIRNENYFNSAGDGLSYEELDCFDRYHKDDIIDAQTFASLREVDFNDIGLSRSYIVSAYSPNSSVKLHFSYKGSTITRKVSIFSGDTLVMAMENGGIFQE